MLKSAVTDDRRLIVVKLCSKYSSLCDYGTSSQTDGQTTCHGNTAHCVT